MEPVESKAAVRARIRAARAAVDVESRDAASRAACQRALRLPEVASARAVLAYAALPEEIDPAPLVASLRTLGARVALPRVCGPGVLSLHWVEADASLEPGALGVHEPDQATEWARPEEFDLVIVPGVAFDPACARLGFGGGFYDALLPILPRRVATVALAFDEQIVREVPCEEHDVPVGVVVTPSRVIRPAG